MEKYLNKIIQGDCRDYVNIFPQEAYIISDPPYNQKYHYENYNDNLSEQEYKEMLSIVFGQRKSIIIHYPEETINILSKLPLGMCEQVVSWVYPSNTAKQSRLITWWNCKTDMKKIPQPYKNPKDKRIKKRIEEGKMARGYDWWEINQVKNVSKKDNIHSCPIPEKVAEKIILSTTKEGDTIIDPFCGSGTILVIAKKLNRNYIGIELSDKYIEIANRKLNYEPK